MYRSLLFVPGDSDRKIAKACGGDADALIFDLEDSVAPANKERAREVTAAALDKDFPNRKLVRVNALDTGLTEADLDALVPHAPEAVLLPKCASLADIDLVSGYLADREAAHGLDAGSIGIMPVATESARALRNLMRSDWSHPRLAAMMWGAEDISADIGAFANREEGEYTGIFRMARDVCFLAAKEAGALAIDTVYVNFSDPDGLAREAAMSYRAGWDGKAAIHPAQVPVINRAFTPSESQVDWARRVMEALEGGAHGVASLDGQMLDMPHRRNAERILAAAAPRER